MDWIREWIIQIAAVIVIGSICDIIMVEGEIKKYVKPILGVILIFTIIRPITAVSGNELRLDILQESMNKSLEISEMTEERQISDIVSIYENKLNEKISEMIRARFQLEAEVSASTNNNKGNLGSIENIDVILKVSEGEVVNAESIKRYVSEELGVDRERIKVKLP